MAVTPTKILNSVYLRFTGFALLAAYLFTTVGITGCANMQPPMGGPRDTIAPRLEKSTPEADKTNFKGSVVRFEFDEYVKLDNLNENLIINPPQDKYPLIVSKLRNVSIKLLDTLQPNTTYTINFGNAIRDVNEGNPASNFSYSFSTGPYIDSLELAGTVVDAETGLPDSTLMVILHVNEGDSTVAKDKPRFATRPNGKGIFHFDHLPGGEFYIYALKDEGVRRYTSNQVPFAFYDSKVAAGSPDSVRLRAFIAEKEPEKPAAGPAPAVGRNKRNEEKKFTYLVSAAPAQDILEPLEINFETPLKTFDSSKIRLTDTLYTTIPNYTLQLDSLRTTVTISTPWKEDSDYRLILAKAFASDSADLTTAKADTIEFKTKAEREYGLLKLVLRGIDMSRNPVLQFVENEKVSMHYPLTGNTFTQQLFPPGQYTIRILYDENGNGVWDTGDYWTRKQPEVVLPFTQSITVKPNWENEVEISL